MRTIRHVATHVALGVVVAAAVAAVCLGAQSTDHNHAAMAGQATMDQTPPERLPPPKRLSGIGNAHIPITGSREVQQWFDQGLNLYHDYWEYESARAFQQAIRIDPECAMCYWGLALAEGFYHSNSPAYAAPALAKAWALIERAGPREQLYIRASVAGFPESQSIWRSLVTQYPDDLQAQIFLARTLPGEEGLAALERVMKVDARNSAAHHYYIHALEATAHPERALPSARVLARLAPSSGHMVHMPGHIFFRLGDYSSAERAFAESLRVDERYMRDQHVDPEDDWNYVHNLMYAVANLLEEGKLAKATTMSMKLGGARGVLASTLYVYSTRDSMSRLDPGLPVAVRTANWPLVADLSRGAAVPSDRPNLLFLQAQLANVAAGMQAIESRDFTDADRRSRDLDDALASVVTPTPNGAASAPVANSAGPPQIAVRPDALLAPILSTLRIMALELRGALLLARGMNDASEEAFSQAAQAAEGLGYREPPIYIRPVHESHGAALLSAGRWADARLAFERALVDRPRSGFGLYGIALSSEKAGDMDRASREYAVFLDAWKDADRSLPQVIHARKFVASHQSLTAP